MTLSRVTTCRSVLTREYQGACDSTIWLMMIGAVPRLRLGVVPASSGVAPPPSGPTLLHTPFVELVQVVLTSIMPAGSRQACEANWQSVPIGPPWMTRLMSSLDSWIPTVKLWKGPREVPSHVPVPVM